jgi:hypothetical protein
MVSDESLQELHEFADQLGIPPRGFHGDHYDLPQYMRDKAVQLGAKPTTSKELVRRLGAAGLRLTAAQRRVFTQSNAAK